MIRLLQLSLSILFLLPVAVIAQPACGTTEAHKQAIKENDVYREGYNKTQAFLKTLKPNQYKTVINGANTEYHIACVVHVMHTGGAVGSNYNPTDAAIQNFLNHINEGFNNTNDVASVPGTNNSVNTPFRFYLAQRDEANSCSATTGINRVNMGSNATYNSSGVGTPGISDASLKATHHWNDLDYYNIYIVNRINGEDGYSTVGTYTAGYAYFPIEGGFTQDGMVVLAYQVNSTNSVFIHELGHGFNLLHTFEGGSETVCPSNGVCTTDNDEVCDTEPYRLIFTCNPSGTNPCTGTNYSLTQVQFNYMSYNGCTDRFTAGQLTRMTDVIDNVRTGYKNSAAVDAPSGTLPTSIAGPTYTSANAGNNFDMGPSYVKVNTIDYTSHGYSNEGSGDKHYVDHTCNQSTSLIKNTNYPITVKTKTNAQKVAVYIDYDNNGTFTNGSPERVFTSTGTSGDFTHTGSFTVPISGVTLNTPLRMRVISDFTSSTMTPTMQLQYGQAEDYTVMIYGFPLSVQWKEFNAVLKNNSDVELYWSTLSEINNDRFELQHSADGITYNTIYQVKGRGLTEETSRYSFLDKNALPGRNYYRVRQFDVDGKYSDSEIRDVNLEAAPFDISLYPNPTSNELKMNFNMAKDGNLDILIFDVNGKMYHHELLSVQKGNQYKAIATDQLPQGVYFIKLQHNKGTEIKRFVKL
ncbi:MAG: zinc-dependent metalloprotease [Chitinophagaceae bacterium]|nr:zinc-dependent metalloprotease [Chitinophagaceae bacterium]